VRATCRRFRIHVYRVPILSNSPWPRRPWSYRWCVRKGGSAGPYRIEMPFPLAHPAAVLPLRRYCPGYLSFPALVVGSISPDAGYLFGRLGLDDISHQVVGIFCFCLPLSLAILWIAYGLGRRVLRGARNPLGRVFSPVLEQPVGSLLTIVSSVLIGAATHLLWDSFTHKNGWFVEHLTFLQSPVGLVANRRLKLCHVLWYGSTFAGIAWLGLTYQRWRGVASDGASRRSPGPLGIGNTLVLAGLVVPVAMVHHLIRSALANYLVAVFSGLLIIGFVLLVERQLGHGAKRVANQEPV
jgi:Domain of unknown function (DUF4184)